MKIQIANFMLCTALALSAMTGMKAQADSFYPPRLTDRLYGTNQGNTGDCDSEATVGALEQTFANQGLSVRLSLYYRHAWRRMDDWQSSADLMLNLDENDKGLLREMGPLVPEFMWPEDGSGINTQNSGVRPHPAVAIVTDPKFQPATNFGFQEQDLTYQSGYSNTGSFQQVKDAVASGAAVTVSIDSAIFETGIFDDVTGLVLPSMISQLLKDRTMSHQVAVMGFDDNFYSAEFPDNPGALIVRNTWNDSNAINQITQADVTEPKMKTALARLRLKMSSILLPGYYAIPYAYMNSLFGNDAHGSFRIYTMNWPAYEAMASDLEEDYSIVSAPFACQSPGNAMMDASYEAWSEIESFRDDQLSLENPAAGPMERKRAKEELEGILANESNMLRSSNYASPAAFQVARLAYNSFTGVDQVKNFYSGAFNDYYCPSESPSKSSVWPGWDIAKAPLFQSGIDVISADVYSVISWMQFLKQAAALKIPSPLPLDQ